MTDKQNRTILICEDEEHIRVSVRYVVAKLGFRCLEAHDGEEGYAMANSEHPDLIILDVGMPGMTGYEVCEKLRADSAFDNTPIVILTAFGQAADEQRAYDVGANRYLAKPFSPRALKSLLSELLP
jgi:DNA-binding response OmpR family regulator